MNIYCNRLHDSKQFNFFPVVKEVSTELSMLGKSPFVKIHDDYCDYGTGFAIRNPKTRNTTIWVIYNESFDDEGDLEYYEMTPIPDTIKEFPHLASWKLVVFND